jgi:hypothetical protein
MRKLILSTVIVLVGLWAAEAWSQSMEPVEWADEQVFSQPPRVVGFRKGKALLHFATVRPMAATVHYGAFPADEDLCLPAFRFRTRAKELSPEGGYEAELRVYKFEYDTYNIAGGSSLEGVVAYRVGVMDNEEGIVRYLDPASSRVLWWIWSRIARRSSPWTQTAYASPESAWAIACCSAVTGREIP